MRKIILRRIFMRKRFLRWIFVLTPPLKLACVNIKEVYDKTYDFASLHFFVNTNFWVTNLLRWISCASFFVNSLPDFQTKKIWFAGTCARDLNCRDRDQDRDLSSRDRDVCLHARDETETRPSIGLETVSRPRRRDRDHIPVTCVFARKVQPSSRPADCKKFTSVRN